MELIQGNMMVLQYKAKFIELARFGPYISRNDEYKIGISEGFTPRYLCMHGCPTIDHSY